MTGTTSILAREFGALFINDALMPSQYAAMHRREEMPEPERNLRRAILHDAVDLLHKYAEHARRDLPEERETKWRHEYVEARRWMDADDRGQPFSFVLVCEALGLDADAIRSRMLARCPKIPLVPASARLAAVPTSGHANRPPERTSSTELRDRAWAWALARGGIWTSHDLASGVRCSLEQARGFASRWVTMGRVEIVGRRAQRTQVTLYRVRVVG